jgi:hypothetical protein
VSISLPIVFIIFQSSGFGQVVFFLNFFRQTYVKYHGMVLPNWPQYLKLGHVQDLEGTLVPAKNYPKFWDLVDFQNL